MCVPQPWPSAMAHRPICVNAKWIRFVRATADIFLDFVDLP